MRIQDTKHFKNDQDAEKFLRELERNGHNPDVIISTGNDEVGIELTYRYTDNSQEEEPCGT